MASRDVHVGGRSIPLGCWQPAMHGPLAERIGLQSIGCRSADGHHRHIDWDNRTRVRPAATPFLILQWTLAGMGRFRHANSTWDLPAGHGFLCRVPSHTGYSLPADASWSWLWLNLEGPWAFDLADQAIIAHGHTFQLDPAEPSATAFLDLACDLATQRGARGASACLAIIGLLTRLAAGTPEEGRSALERARALLHQRMHDPDLDGEALAAEAGLSRAHFVRRFTASFGSPPRTYLRELRLRRATDLLSLDGCSALAVAQQCGFRSAAHFGAVFRQRYGSSPIAWRSEHAR